MNRAKLDADIDQTRIRNKLQKTKGWRVEKIINLSLSIMYWAEEEEKKGKKKKKSNG